jgi:L-arabinose isomerase
MANMKEHKIVVGHWKSERVQKKIGDWMITAIGLVESNHLRVALLSVIPSINVLFHAAISTPE